jgi:hypothetical protein
LILYFLLNDLQHKQQPQATTTTTTNMPQNWEFLKSEWGMKYLGKSNVSDTKEYIKDYNKFNYEKKKKEDPNYLKKHCAYQQSEKYKIQRREYQKKRYQRMYENREGFVDRRYKTDKLSDDPYKAGRCECGGKFSSRATWRIHTKSKLHNRWLNQEFGSLPPPPADWLV